MTAGKWPGWVRRGAYMYPDRSPWRDVTRENMRKLAKAWIVEGDGGAKMRQADKAVLITWVSGWIRGFCRLVPHHRQPASERVVAINDLAWDLDMWTDGGHANPEPVSALLSAAGWMPS